MEHSLLADSIVSLAAFFGLNILISAIKRSDQDSISRRFLFGIYVIEVILVSRILSWMTGIAFFDSITLAAAGVLPLATIILTEGLLRRHAASWVKITAVTSALLFIPLSLLPNDVSEPGRSVLLLAFQVWGFLTAGYMVLTRDKATLSFAENKVIERIALSIPLIVPLIITDFRFHGFESPIRLGGVAILFMCWLTISLERSHLKNSDMLLAFFVLISSSLFAAITIAYLHDMNLAGYIQTAVIVLSVTIAAVLYNDGSSLRYDERRDSLLRQIAVGNIETSASFLNGLRHHPLVDDALLLTSDDLADLDMKLLRKVFKADPVQKIAKPNGVASTMTAEQEHLSWLFTRFNASHVMLVSEKPITLLALNMPALSSSPGAEIELRAVQRMAILISQRKAA